MRFHSFKVFVAAAVASVVTAASPGTSRGAAVVNLSLLVNPANHTWQAFADVQDSTSAGLSGIQFDVTATGGITLGTTQGASATSFNDLPVGNLVTGARSSTPAGFFNFTNAQDIVPGLDLQFRGGQTGQYQFNASSGHGNIVLGFGKPGQSGNLAGDTALFIPWSYPAIIADGTYTGNSGSIGISGSVAGTSLLPDSATTTSGNLFAAHLADTVNGQTVAVPEPTGAMLLALGAIAIVRRRAAR